MHIRAHRIHLIADEEERQERCLTELTAALSDETLKWIANRDFTQEERANPDALVQAFEDHIRESTNPTVTVVELFTMKRHQHETADHLNARINEKLNEVDFSVITDIRDYFGMTATIIANDPALRKRMYLRQGLHLRQGTCRCQSGRVSYCPFENGIISRYNIGGHKRHVNIQKGSECQKPSCTGPTGPADPLLERHSR
jgi:hypothetical protein